MCGKDSLRQESSLDANTRVDFIGEQIFASLNASLHRRFRLIHNKGEIFTKEQADNTLTR